MNEAPVKETLGFQAEVTQLLHLMIHSLYGNKQIFLRELVSNASDACDRLRFDSISNAALLENDAELRIRVSYDKAARTITISDNGIGMSRQEVIDHIGTIAKSGTKRIPADAHLRQREGRAPHRPVRRRLLRVVHRRRSRDPRDAARRVERRRGRAVGERRRRRATRSSRSARKGAAPTSSSTCGRTKTTCCRARRSAPSSASTPTTSPCRS